MLLKLLEVLRCPACHGDLRCERAEELPRPSGEHDTATGRDDEIVHGILLCGACKHRYPIVDGIPRFVPSEDYAASFGLQWNRFRLEQMDSANATSLSERRFYGETAWEPEWLRGRWILEAGCGAGRFLEIAARAGAEVIGVDLSASVNSARQTLAAHKNVHLVQASLYELPFAAASMAGVYSLGVLQHTPSPRNAVAKLVQLLTPAGHMAVTVYEHKPWTRWNAKYLVRPLTRRLPKRALLLLIRLVMPVMFLITEILFRIPFLAHFFHFVIPVANYVEQRELTWRDRYRWAILDTFDMLSPRFDSPMTETELRQWFLAAGLGETRRLPTEGLTLVAEKPAARAAEA